MGVFEFRGSQGKGRLRVLLHPVCRDRFIAWVFLFPNRASLGGVSKGLSRMTGKLSHPALRGRARELGVSVLLSDVVVDTYV
jgi:hypothetical protein